MNIEYANVSISPVTEEITVSYHTATMEEFIFYYDMFSFAEPQEGFVSPSQVYVCSHGPFTMFAPRGMDLDAVIRELRSSTRFKQQCEDKFKANLEQRARDNRWYNRLWKWLTE